MKCILIGVVIALLILALNYLLGKRLLSKTRLPTSVGKETKSQRVLRKENDKRFGKLPQK